MSSSSRSIAFAVLSLALGGCGSCVNDEAPPIPTPAATNTGDGSHVGAVKMLGRGNYRKFATRDSGAAEGDPPP
jgi:hypothetical protein